MDWQLIIVFLLNHCVRIRYVTHATILSFISAWFRMNTAHERAMGTNTNAAYVEQCPNEHIGYAYNPTCVNTRLNYWEMERA